MLVDYNVVRFCSIECKMQMSGELSVCWMVDAWIYARDVAYRLDNMYDGYTYTLPTLADVLNIGRLVEPHDNLNGFRRCGVQIGVDVKMNWEDIPRQMGNLLDALYEPRIQRDGYSMSVISPEQFFKEYEEIHPFRDGNGRSGQILYNWVNGTLNAPVWAPNFWGDGRRTIGFGAS